jgi:hypothetical protein
MVTNVLDTDLSKYKHLWTDDLHNHLLFTLNYYGEVIYLIYNIPSKKVVVTKSAELDKYIVEKMLINGAKVVDDNLLASHKH